jgi:hypothetical protein
MRALLAALGTTNSHELRFCPSVEDHGVQVSITVAFASKDVWRLASGRGLEERGMVTCTQAVGEMRGLHNRKTTPERAPSSSMARQYLIPSVGSSLP